MANNNAIRPRVRKRPGRLFSAVAIGAVSAVTASVGVSGGMAFAQPDYPTWNDVEKAKQDESTKQAEIAKLTTLLQGLAIRAADTTTTSLKAAEAYRVTQDQLDAATAREASLRAQAKTAQATADTSKMRAGLIAAHLAKAGASDLSMNLFLNGNTADDLLQQLGTASKLSEQSETIYSRATQDKNTADSLGDQATSATAERERLTEESKATFDTASVAAAAAQAAYDTQQRKSAELFEQLALLKDTTAEAERSFHAGEDAAAAAAAFAKAQAAAAKIAAQAVAQAAAQVVAQPAQAAVEPAQAVAQPAAPVTPPASGNSGGNRGGSTGAATAPAPAQIDPTPLASNAGAVATAISFARQQLGDRYVLGGSGPDAWDCSGLTKAAYAAAGIYVGTHSATNQYITMAGQGRLVSFAQVQVGDLVFWGNPGNYYHVAIYMGGGQVLEAPNPASPVRIHSIWSFGDVAPYAGRPA